MDKQINFGDYAILDPVEHYFKKAPNTYWRLLPITSGMELARSKFMMHNRVIEGPYGDRIEMPPTTMEIVYRELALTFGGTNLAYENGDLVLEEGASIEQIEAVLAKMPPEMVKEVWACLADLGDNWGPSRPKAK